MTNIHYFHWHCFLWQRILVQWSVLWTIRFLSGKVYFRRLVVAEALVLRRHQIVIKDQEVRILADFDRALERRLLQLVLQDGWRFQTRLASVWRSKRCQHLFRLCRQPGPPEQYTIEHFLKDEACGWTCKCAQKTQEERHNHILLKIRQGKTIWTDHFSFR